MKRLCVFAGSSTGSRPEYRDAARRLGVALARRGLGIVYGGGSVGLMGVLADAALGEGGEVIGVIPNGLATRELAHPGLTEMRVVGSMHERKALMASLVDGFLALPGGFGTLEETLEVLTWSQLGIHRKPVGILNVRDYYGSLRGLLAHAVTEGFLGPDCLALLVWGDAPEVIVDALARWRPPGLARAWLDASQA